MQEQVRMWRLASDDPVLCMAGQTSEYQITPRGEYVFGVILHEAMTARRGRARHLLRPGQLVAWDPSDLSRWHGRGWAALVGAAHRR